ncbi:lipid-A-disaccharide synthase [Limibacillus halophilus]
MTNSDQAPLHVFLIAGEPSGDQLGARLMAALKQETGGAVRFSGVGGPLMEAEGMKSSIPMGELAVMGIVEVLPQALNILRRMRETAEEALAAKPDLYLSIDMPDFGLGVAKRLRAAGVTFPLVHYVAPQVWAWKAKRAEKMVFLDHLLVLLPFEPPYFEKHGLATSFVGHPVVEISGEAGDPREFLTRQGLDPDAPTLCLLPGSRKMEVNRLLSLFRETVDLLLPRVPGLQVVVPTVSTVAERVRLDLASWSLPSAVVEGQENKRDAFASSLAALAASGTVAVELAAAGLPAIISYKVNALSAAVARRVLKVRFASLINILLDREVQPEYLQEKATPAALSAALLTLIENPAAREAQRDAVRPALEMLGAGGLPPSHRAARKVLELAGRPVEQK